MAPQQPTVGLAGSRIIDEGLQSSDKKTVTKMEFPSGSCTATGALKGIPREGATDYKGPKLGDCYADSVEDTNMLKVFVLTLITLYGTYMLQYVQ